MRIRKAKLEDAAGIAHVHIASWQTTYRGIVPDMYLEKLVIQERIERWQRIMDQGTSCTYIAENDDGKIVGFINGGAERTGRYHYDGELYAIYLLEDYQRQGLGKKLVLQLAETLKEQKYKNMLVWVLKNNPSKRFYESLNPEKVDEKTINIGGVDLTEKAFGWPNLALLCHRLNK